MVEDQSHSVCFGFVSLDGKSEVNEWSLGFCYKDVQNLSAIVCIEIAFA